MDTYFVILELILFIIAGRGIYRDAIDVLYRSHHPIP